LIKKYGKDRLINYTNSDYVRFGSLGHKGIRLGKIILADRKGDILRGTFWDRFDVTGYLRKFRNRRCYLAAVAKVDRKTYRTVGLRGFLEVSVRGGENIRSKEVYFLARTGSMDGYLHGTMRNVGLEIAIDIPLIATEEEVRQFLGNYVKRYTQKDIDGFLSLFSPKAVQNQRDGFDEIKRTYSDLFEQSQELRYHLTDKRIEIYKNTVEVRARYELDQRLKTRGKKRVWKGHIRWILAKENGVLKIRYLDYRH
jgi:ketosteroid isomerase-like protein